MARKKRKLKKQAKILLTVIFLGILSFTIGIAYHYIHPLFEQKPVVIEKPTQVIDNAKKGTIDVLAVGNSDLYSALNPLQLWKEEGISSYVASGPKQNMSLSYYMTKEILKYQKPKVLIIEMDNFFEKRGDDNEQNAITTTYKMCYPLFKETPLWEQIKNEQYVQRTSAHERSLLRGYYLRTMSVANNEGYDYMGINFGEAKMVPFTETYFPKLMEVAKENNCQVLFVCMPSKTSWTYKKHNTVASTAKKYNVPFIDFNVDQYDTGFDWLTDSRDGGNHLNYTGASKITHFMGKYLKDNYQLIDHRKNPNFTDWNEDYDYFLSLLNQ